MSLLLGWLKFKLLMKEELLPKLLLAEEKLLPGGLKATPPINRVDLLRGIILSR
jgi:hypothetical protein